MVISVFLTAEGASQQSPASDLQPIQWKTGGTTAGAGAKAAGVPASDVATVLGVAKARHVVLHFAGPIDEGVRAKLKAGNIALLKYLGSYAYFAKVPGGSQSVAAASDARVGAAYEIQGIWKLHPKIASGDWPSYAVFNLAGASTGEEVETAAVYVMFHPDVDLATEGLAALTARGGLVRDVMETANAFVAWLPKANVAALAEEDAVEWIEPPLPPFSVVNDSNRTITQADEAQAAPYDLDGTGVTVLVYDGGTARATHVDFGGRVHVRDNSGMEDHSTHVAGTVGGSGAASGGKYRGMAPGVVIQSYGLEDDGTGTFLYTNPGDLEHDYNEAVNTYGAQIATNSIGTNTASNGFPCSWEGDYGVTDTVIDNIVCGSLGAPMRIVWANGNERGDGSCGTTYHTTAPPANAKNHISVGALNSNDDSMTYFSSWGPSDDGRLKPDISGPGCQTNDDQGVTSCTDTSDTSYATMCGTSMATPTVAGLCALILQDFQTQFPGVVLPRNSTMKALLAHNAVDCGNPGPDYQYGYGSVRIKDTIDFLRRKSFLEESISQGEDKLYYVSITEGVTSLKATMAWDDPPGAVNIIPELVNDLDLVAIEPDGVTVHYPWTLDPANPGAPAVQTKPDHVNNIEQVVVDQPVTGTWTLKITGTNVAQGPQTFSIATSPNVYTCTSKGILNLDSKEYNCGSVVHITVIDCDLDTDPQVAETVDVTVQSTTQPGGQTVTLTETGPHTATFTNTVRLSPTASPGSLEVSDGDTVTAVYVDADDGQGHHNVAVTATAGLDCVAPAISDVQTSGVGSVSATISFTTGEPSLGGVRCGAVRGGPYSIEREETSLGLSHSFVLYGLDPDTEYFFEVSAKDSVGNEATDNAGGACYTFKTLVRPDYFTELFSSGDNDLKNQTVFFTPDGSASFYHVCRENASSFPVDPSGGNVLTLSDNSFAPVSIGAGQHVSLYGASYGAFYVGSNGNITFSAGDATSTESLWAHFSQPRISALFDYLTVGSGSISWRQLSDRMAVTFQNVSELGTTNSNSFQIQMFFDGQITITWLDVAATDGLAGLSSGQGIPDDFVLSDLTEYDPCDALTIVPNAAFLSSGSLGGPFAPGSISYTLTNAGPGAVNWNASFNQNWLDITPSAGTLQEGDSVVVGVSLNANANALMPNQYADTLTFTDLTAGNCFARKVELDVVDRMTVDPPDGLSAIGVWGGPFTPSSKAYTIANAGAAPLNWTAAVTQPWLDVLPAAGTIGAGETATVTISINAAANALAEGNHAATVTFTDTGTGIATTRKAALTVSTPANAPNPTSISPSHGPVTGETRATISGTYFATSGTTRVTFGGVDATNVEVYDSGGYYGSYIYILCTTPAHLPGPVDVVVFNPDGTPGTLFSGFVYDSPPDPLVVVPTTVFDAQGALGGPFVPAATTYTVFNAGGAPLDWKVGVDQTWLNVAPNAGALAPSDTVAVTAWLTSGAAALTKGNYTGSLVFSNLADAYQVTRAVTLTIAEPVTLTPSDSFVGSGPVGGPFSPANKTYTLTNLSSLPIQWSASVAAAWLDVTPSGGTLAGAGTATITMAFNANANALASGKYADAVTVEDITTGSAQTRGVDLHVVRTHTVPFSDDFESGTLDNWEINDGASGDTPIVRNQTYLESGDLPHSGTHVAFLGDSTSGSIAEATMDLHLDLSAMASAQVSFWYETYELESGNWLQIDIFDGTWHNKITTYNNNQTWLQVVLDLSTYNMINDFIIRFHSVVDSTELYDAVYIDDVSVTGIVADVLRITPAGTDKDFASKGPSGGPFTPASKTYTLTNESGSAISWTMATTQPWLDVAPDVGTLDAGGSITVTVSLNAGAATLPQGTATATLTFTDVTTGAVQTRGARLSIGPAICVPGNPSPADGATGVSLDATLNWSCGASKGESSPGTALAKVAIFQDGNPWGSTANQDVLTSNGIAYTFFGSSDMGIVDLSTYNKVIVSSVQTNSFYATLEANRAWFESYVDAGGKLDLHLAFYTGYLQGIMPGGFKVTFQTADYVTIVDATHPIVTTPHAISEADLDEPETTLGYFSTVPPDAHEIISVNGQPCCMELALGSGRILATVQIVEWHDASRNFLENMTLYEGGSGVGFDVYFGAQNPPATLLCSNTVAQTCAPGTLDYGTNYFWQVVSKNPYGTTPGPVWHFATPPPPVIRVVTPAPLDKALQPDNQWTFDPGMNICNDGVATLNYQVAIQYHAAQSWLTVQPPDSGTVLTGTCADKWVKFDSTGLAPGTYTADVVITHNDPLQPTISVPCSLVVRLGDLIVSPSDPFTASGNQGGPFMPNSITYTLANGGAAPLSWRASATASWLGVVPNAGTLTPSGSCAVTVGLTSGADRLSKGDYAASIVFTDVTSDVSAVRAASLNVLGVPVAQVLPLSLAAFVPTNGRAVLPLTVSNTGDGTLHFAFETPGVNWLALTPTEGTLAGASSVVANVTFTPGNLAPGTYEISLTMTSDDRANPVITVPVTMRVAQAVFVNAGNLSGTEDGVSWPTAFRSIQRAIDIYSQGDIWVAAGTYPETITLNSGARVYGGFAGAETARDQRDFAANPTVIDAGAVKPHYHVVTMSNVTGTRLDGLTITGGAAALPEGYGGGIYCTGYCDATNTIANCRLAGNSAATNCFGSAVACLASASPTITHCLFAANNGYCGTFFVQQSYPLIEECTFGGNTVSGDGAALYYKNAIPSTVSNCVFTGNEAANCGGAVYCINARVLFQNCTFNSNRSDYIAGGAAYLNNASATFANCLFYKNVGAAIYQASSGADPVLTNCLFRINVDDDYWYENRIGLTGAAAVNALPGNSGNVDGGPSFVMYTNGGLTGTWTAAPAYDPMTNRTTLVDSAGLFGVNALAGRLIAPSLVSHWKNMLIMANTATTVVVLGDATGFTQLGSQYCVVDLHLTAPWSAAVDTGAAVNAPESDIEDHPRPVDVPGVGVDGTGTEFDIGAYECGDYTAPTGSLAINRGAIATNSTGVALSLVAADSESGVRMMRLSQDGVWDTERWQPYTVTAPWVLASGDGVKTVYVQYCDAAGNVSGTFRSTITLDTVSPAVEIGPPSVPATQGGPVVFTVTYSAAGGGSIAAITLANGDITLNKTGTANGTLDGSGTDLSPRTVTISGITGDGTLSISIASGTATDSAGRTALPAGPSAPVVVDNTSPTGTLSINGGAPRTNSTNVTLSILGDDGAGSGVSNMRFSNDNTTWSDWQAYANNTAWTLTPGEGVKTVYLQCRDAAGNVSSDIIRAEILLDQTPPTATFTLDDRTPTSADVVHFTVHFSEPMATPLTAGNLMLTPNSLAARIQMVSSGASACTVAVTPLDPDACGTLGIAISGGALRDLAGNLYGGGSSPLYAIENWRGFAESLPNASVYVGDTQTFRVRPDACGADTFAYEWCWSDGGQNILPVGGSTDTLTLDRVKAENAGFYWCYVIFDGAYYPSNAALLSVADHLKITRQPQDGKVSVGDVYRFDVATEGGFPPLSYLWKHDGKSVSVTSSCELRVLTECDSGLGSYSVEVSDSNMDVIESDPALLTIDTTGLPGETMAGAALLVLGCAAAGIWRIVRSLKRRHANT